MGADFIIGVNVSEGLLSRDELNSALDILSQSAFITNEKDFVQQKEKCDLFININLNDFSAADFNKADTIIKLGVVAGDLYLDSLKTLKASWGGEDERVAKTINMDTTWVFDTVNVLNVNQAGEVKQIEKLKLAEAITLHDLETELGEIYGYRQYTKMSYAIKQQDESNVLELQVQKAPPVRVKAAIHYDNENSGRLLLHLSMYNQLLNHSRLMIEADLASSPKALFNYIKYLTKNHDWAFKIQSQLNSYSIPQSTNGQVNSVLNDLHWNAYAGLQFLGLRNWAFMPFWGIDYGKLNPTVADNTLQIIDKIEQSGFLGGFLAHHDSRDQLFFTKSGSSIYAYALYRYNVAEKVKTELGKVDIEVEDQYYQLYLDYQQYIKVSDRSAFKLSGTGALSQSSSIGFTDFYIMGGFNPLFSNAHSFAGVKAYSYALTSFVLTEFMYQFELASNLYLMPSAYYLTSRYPVLLINGDAENLNDDGNENIAFSLQVGYDTFIGPVILGAAEDFKEKGTKFFISLGYYFNSRRF